MKRKFNGVKIINKNDRASVEANIDRVLGQLKYTLLNHLDAELCNKILYWLNDWGSDYLLNEKTFDYDSLIKYNQWSIVEANLGFKIGSEAGGLHYATIVDKDNAKASKVVMVIPFKSLDIDKTPDDIDKKTEVYLGNQLFLPEVENYKRELEDIDLFIEKNGANDKILKRKSFCLKQYDNLQKGTIAQIGQMCLMSKMRIYYPTESNDRLYGLKLSDENIKDIIDKFQALYF